MTLVILTGRGPQHRYVAGALAAAFPEALAAIVVADPPARPAVQRVRGYLRRYTAPQLASRAAAKLVDRVTGASAGRQRIVAAKLFPGGDAGRMPREDLVRSVPSHNHASCLELLDAIAPDIISVYGTAVIREPVMRRARRAILNMHTGLSPRYRGADSVFWALYNGEPGWIGATVHGLEAALDGGPIFGTRRVAVDPDDDEATLFAKTVVAGAALYVDVVRAVRHGTETTAPQNLAEGREYRFVDRTVIAEWRVARALRRGLLRGAPPL